ncbi:MAG: biotin/lipoyl-containing protein, partial [Luteimonas sp.]
DATSPWAITDGWRLGHAGKRVIALQHRDQRIEFSASGSNGDYRIARDGKITQVTGARVKGSVLSARFDSVARRVTAQVDETRVLVHDGIHRMRLAIVPVYQRQPSAQGSDEHRLQAPMPGRVVLVKVKPGDQVIAGQEVLVIEAMKMELGLKAPRDGVIAEVRAAAGDFVEAEAVLVTLDP